MDVWDNMYNYWRRMRRMMMNHVVQHTHSPILGSTDAKRRDRVLRSDAIHNVQAIQAGRRAGVSVNHARAFGYAAPLLPSADESEGGLRSCQDFLLFFAEEASKEIEAEPRRNQPGNR
jgi:hypothetical protein